jgi:hypothetical protein
MVTWQVISDAAAVAAVAMSVGGIGCWAPIGWPGDW